MQVAGSVLLPVRIPTARLRAVARAWAALLQAPVRRTALPSRAIRTAQARLPGAGAAYGAPPGGPPPQDFGAQMNQGFQQAGQQFGQAADQFGQRDEAAAACSPTRAARR